jgi:uncharacterized protein YqgC (DUF456 family)
MNTLLVVIALIMGLVGLLGVFVPIVPGTILSFVGLICVFCTTESTISIGTLILWGVVSLVVILLDYILPGYFSKLFGGTKAGITGATVGTIVGIFFGVPGIILGPFFGAIAGEMIGSKAPIEKAFKVGMGSMLSFFVGTGIKLVAAVYMLYYIVKVFIAVVI